MSASNYPRRIFLDTNVYIIGAAVVDSPEAVIINWLGFTGRPVEPIEVIVSDALFSQILRVARRLQGKDWSGQIITRIWQGMNVNYVFYDDQEVQTLLQANLIPREDVTIFLSAKAGNADCFVSANRELVRTLAQEMGAFECLYAAEFVEKYIQVSAGGKENNG